MINILNKYLNLYFELHVHPSDRNILLFVSKPNFNDIQCMCNIKMKAAYSLKTMESRCNFKNNDNDTKVQKE